MRLALYLFRQRRWSSPHPVPLRCDHELPLRVPGSARGQCFRLPRTVVAVAFSVVEVSPWTVSLAAAGEAKTSLEAAVEVGVAAIGEPAAASIDPA